MKYLNYKYLKYGWLVIGLSWFFVYIRDKQTIYLILAFFFFSYGSVEYKFKSKKSIAMSDEEKEEIKRMISNNIDSVKVIKKIRIYTDLDLVEAKKLYDELLMEIE